MKNVKKILSVLALIVLVGSDFLTSISYALDDMLEDSVVVQTENEEEIESIETEEEKIDEEDVEDVYESESMEEEELETENLTGDIVEEGTGEVSEIGSGEVEELTEETAEGATGDIAKELTGEVIESIRTGEETVIENITYNEEPIIGEKTYNDVTVRVEALTGIFPEGTELKIEPIKWWSLSSLKDKLVEEKEEIKEDTTIVAFDITFKYEGEEVQPKDGEKVKVTFDYSSNDKFKNAEADNRQTIKIYHINDKDENGEKVEKGEEIVEKMEINQTASAEIDNGLVINVESFSTYTIVTQRAEELDENNNPKTWILGKDYNTINIARPEGLTNADGPEGFTIMDRNLGADAYMGEAGKTATDWYGYLYQWGNNYGFSSNSSVTPTIGTSQIDISGYGEYYSGIFITGYDNWTQDINNLWGGESDSLSNNRGLDDISATSENRQGPCPNGWHVPSIGERSKLIEYWADEYIASGGNVSINTEDNLKSINNSTAKNIFTERFKLPSGGRRDKDTADLIGQVFVGAYWSTSPGSSPIYYAHFLYLDSSFIQTNPSSGRSHALSVRCFRDEYIVDNNPINSTGYFKAFDGGETSLFGMDFNKEIITGFTRNTTLELADVLNKSGVTEIQSTTGDYISGYPIYGWIENNDFNWWSEANTVYFHPDTTRAFSEMSGMKIIDLNGTSTELVENFAFWFHRNKVLTTIKGKINTNGVKIFDDSGVIYMETVEHESPTNQGMSFMFNDCKKLTSVDLSEFNTTNVIDMKRMFAGCESMTGIDVSHFDTHNVKTFYWMFRKMLEIQELDVSNFDTSSAISMFGMFTSNDTSKTKLKTITLGENWDTSNVKLMTNMFNGLSKLETIYADVDFDTSSLTNSNTMFSSDNNLVGGRGLSNETPYNSSKVKDQYAKIASDNPAQSGYFTRHTEASEYAVIFKNRDGNILWSGNVAVGETPLYNGTQPSRPSTEQYVYSFNGWYPEVTPVTTDATYTALYSENPRLYTVNLTGTPAGFGTLSTESLQKGYGTDIIIEGNQLTIGGEIVTLTGNEGYEFQEWTGTCGKVEKQVCDELLVYSHPDPIEFTGGNNLIITNEGYDLFSESNYQKDFEISFDIVDQNLSSSVNQATILNVKDEDQDDIWPGFVVRRSSSTNKIEITARGVDGRDASTKGYTATDVHSMKISRINSILYVSVNGGTNQQLYDYSGFNNYFTKPITFGSSYKDDDHLFRPAKITLSNILIKSADNCYTGNVYIVTGDCQMTAKFKEVEEHPKVTVNHHWMNIGGSDYTIHETEYFSGNIGDEFTAIEKVYTGFTAKLNNDDTIIISGDNNSNVIDLYYDRHRGYFYFLIDPFNSAAITVSGCDNGTCWYGEDVQLTVQEETGYIFNSWGIPTSITLPEGLDRTQKTLSFTMPEINDMQIRWSVSLTAIPYTIIYHLDGGEEVEHNQTEYTAGNFVIYVTDPIKTGYDFLGWTGGVINGPKLSGPTTGLVIVVNDMGNIEVGDREYYANWTGVEYVVTVYIEPENGGTVHGSGVYHYKDRISLLATPNVDSGYQFTGWYVGYDKISDYYQIGLQADDSGGTGLTAKFELKTYQVCVSSDYYRGSHYPSAGCYPYQHGSIVTVNAWPYEGYKVRNWMINDWERKTGDNQTYTGDNLDLTINWDTNVFINFEPIKYNVVYMSGDTILTGLYPSEYDVETLICDENYSYEYGGCMYYLPTLTRDGYDFTGWYNTPLVSSYDRIKVLSGVGDKAIYAGWLVHDYNITYHLGSGESFSGAFYPYEYESYNIETPSTALPQAQKSGYVFSGWVDYNGKLFTEFGGGMTGDLDLYPTWRPDVMNITVNYYEMNTGGQYYPSSWTYYETYHYTGFTNSGFTAPDYTTTGFRLDGNMHPNGNPSIVISGNENANVIDVYYEREKYNLETLWPTSWADMTITPSPIEYNSYYFGTEINITIAEHIGYRFTGWYQEEGMEFPADEVMDLTSRNITFHMPAHNVKVFPDMEHIEYVLTFTGYEGAEVTNREYIHVTLTGENYEWYDTELVLPDLNKPGYNFLGWFSGEAYVWSTYYWWQDHYPTWHMPAQDIELRAEFTGRTDMRYYRYYYLQDTEGTGYTLSGNLTDSEYDGVTNQEIPGRFGRKYITGFEYTGFGYSGEAMLPREEWPIIKATGENYVDLYYDRKVDSVYVEYDVNKMSVTGTGEYRYEAPVTLTATVKTGYEFSGFNSYWGELLTTDPVYNFTMPDGYVYLRANADPIVYSIDYELNGGESYYSYPTGYTIEDENFYLSDPYKDGYTFLGWTGGVISGEQLSGLTTELVIPAGSVGDRKYFANWEPAEVDVTVNYHLKKIDAENNELLDDSVFFTGKMFTGLTDDVVDISEAYGIGIEGYSYTTAIVYGPDLSGGVETGTTTVLSGRSIDIYYTPIKYDFTVVAGPNTTTSGTSISTGYYYGAYVTLSGDSTDDCFEWDKWGSQTLPEGKNQQHTTFEMPAHNVIVESMVKEKSYNIVFNANGGTGMMSTLSVQCTTGTLAPNKFERDGYTFTGWSRNAEGPVEFTGESDIHRLSTESGGEVTLFAIWDVNWYTVTFDLNGGSLTGDMTLTTGYTIKTPAISLENYIPIKTGYNFSGWYKGDDVANNIAGGEIGNYTLTAKWEAIPFTVSFNSASGTAVESQIYYYDNLLSGLNSAVTTRTGYDFSGWYLSGVLYTSGSRMPAENITLTAKWTPLTGIEYQVNHRGENTGDNNYSILLSGYKMYGTSDTQTIASSLEFEGFTLSGSVNQEIINPDGTTVVDIYYDRNEYEVTTGTTENGSISGETGNQRYGKRITFTAHPSAGYRLARWLKNGEEILSGGAVRTGEEIEIEVDTGMEISAEFKARGDTPYYVEYYKENLDGGYDVWTGIQYGTSDTEGVAQELIFTGFIYDSGNVNNVITGNIDGDGSKVLKMYYNREIYTITWLNEDGTDMDTTSVKYGEVPTHADPTQPADAHYTYKFKGWDPEPTFATGEISYRATYEHIVNKHTITWKNDDGSLIDKTMVEYGTIPTHAKPTKTETEDYRYIFAGWDPEVVAVVGDAEYTAVFNAEKKEKSSKGGGMSGGGGRGGNIDNSDNQHGSAEERSDLFTGDNDTNSGNINDEPLSLYEWVHENDITTMDTLEYADPDGLLTRGHLAKMVVNYMVNVLGRKIPYDVTYNCRYWGDDESSRESDEIRDYATKACAFGVMGINMEDNKFLPNSIVTRAEFGTVMSRVLRGDKYDITDTDNRSYYENHLQALKKDNILTQIANPETRWEIRKWVWLVFRRIVEKYKK